MSGAKVIGGPSGKIRTVPVSKSAGKDKQQLSGKTKKSMLAALLLLLLLGIVWALWPGDQMASKVAALRAQLDAEGLTREQRREIFSKADPEVREAMFEQRRAEWDAQERKWLREFFSKSKEQQIAEIDKRIDEMERRRKEREQRAKSNNNGNQSRGNNQNANNRGNRGNGDRDSIARRDSYLARTSPEQRAQSAAYRQMMQQRMQQRGISGGGGGGWGGGGRGGRPG